MLDPLREGAMQVIVDNVVRQPKTYSLEIIVPFQPLGPYIVRGVTEFTQMIGGFIDIFGGDSAIYESIFAIAFAIVKAAQRVADIATKFPTTDDAAFLNKNSLEAMAEDQKILTMKMWTGYQYKYVFITGLTLEKQPLEDGVFRGTLQVQEMPILSITPVDAKPPDIKRHWTAAAVQAAQGALSAIPIAWTRVEKASGPAPSTGMPVIPGVPEI
jgi:hypothetical protein